MFKFLDYFYILAKLTTSIVLFLLTVAMGYLLYNSYQRISTKNDTDYQIQSISKKIETNNNLLLNIEKKIKNNVQNINELKIILSANKENIDNLDNSKDIKYLLEMNENFQKKLDDLSLYYDDKAKNKDNNLYKNLNHIDSLIKMILSKYKNGEDVLSEISLLEESLPKKNFEFFEKLYLLQTNKFLGFNNLEKEFDKSLNLYVKNKFLKENQNSVLNFLSKFVDIRPNNLNNYEDKDLNILMSVKKFIELQDIQKALKQITLLDKNTIFFEEWVQQAKIFLEFKSEIEKVRKFV